jgi:hypothetical protein
MKFSIRWVSFAAVLIFSTSLVRADTLGVSISYYNPDYVNTGIWTLGYSFQVKVPITVTALAVLDAYTDGLNVSHDVGIWNDSGTLLASTNVAAGTVAPILNGFRYATISGLALSAGDIYYVGSVNGIDNDAWVQDPGVLADAAEITYLSRRFEFSSGSLVFPDLAGTGSTGYFGGNFLFMPTAVPEPGTLLMLSTGFCLLGFAAWRRKK